LRATPEISQLIVHRSGISDNTLKGISQVDFAARDEFDLCLGKLDKHRKVEIAFVENE
jgi:hypothetical protein